jgi:LDH2 family malate/lactate/ureidoglycolate dehydrogenase
MREDGGVRVPGSRRFENRERSSRDGFELPDALITELKALAA